MAVDIIARAMAGAGGGGGKGKPVIKEITVSISDWDEIEDAEEQQYAPYKYRAMINFQVGTDDDVVVSLINDNPIKFANYGYAIKEISNGQIELVSLKKGSPHGVHTFKVMITSVGVGG